MTTLDHSSKEHRSAALALLPVFSGCRKSLTSTLACAILSLTEFPRYQIGGAIVGKTMTAIFDGRVLYPESPVDLEPDTRYLVTIEPISPQATAADAWDLLETLAGTLEAPDDWASEHDHYLYDTPKRYAEAET